MYRVTCVPAIPIALLMYRMKAYRLRLTNREICVYWTIRWSRSSTLSRCTLDGGRIAVLYTCKQNKGNAIYDSTLRRRRLPKRFFKVFPTLLPVVWLRCTAWLSSKGESIGTPSGISEWPTLLPLWWVVISVPSVPRFLWSFKAFSIEYDGSPLPLRSPGRYSYATLVLSSMEAGGLTYHAWPTPVVPSRLALKVCAFLVVEDPAKPVRHAWRNIGHTFKWPVLRNCVQNVFPRRRPQRLFVGVVDSGNGTVCPTDVTRDVGGVVWTFVMITATDIIEAVNDVGTLKVLLSQMVRPVCRFRIFPQYIQRSMGLVAGIALTEGTRTRDSGCFLWRLL